MAQIASASGIAIGQNYRDFANKEAIIAAICEADLGGWLEEEKLEAAVAAGDRDAILGWIEKIATDTPTREDRRLMCELLDEVGRTTNISEDNRNVKARPRASPEAGPARPSVVRDNTRIVRALPGARPALSTKPNHMKLLN